MNIQTWKLFKKIKQQKDKDLDSQLDYWKKEFDVDNFEEELLRSRFGELSGEGLINIFWADDLPQRITITEKGMSYCYFKERAIELLPFIKLFIK